MLRRNLAVAMVLLALTQQTVAYYTRTSWQQSVKQSNTNPRKQEQEVAVAGESATRDLKFAGLVERLSEPGGSFDTDNLISNEASYLHVLGKMRRMNVNGGAYIGVGPDQNFSYIAQIKPRIAFIIDIRRDNLLQHLLFKSLFAQARNRIEYLCLLFGRPAPEKSKQWESSTVQQLVEYIDRTPPKRELFETTSVAVQVKARSFGVPLTAKNVSTIARIHQSFFDAGLDLRFTSYGRTPRSYYPTYRDLLLEKDLTGRQANYLAAEDGFQFIKSLENKDLIIPVVGDLAGEHAMNQISRVITERGERVSAFYTSNIEFYLMRENSFDRFAHNIERLPMDERSVIIRSYFGGAYRSQSPQSVPGYYSTQLLQTMQSFVAEHKSGGYHTYSDLVDKQVLDLR